MLEMVERLQDKVASVQQNSMLCPLLPCCCCWKCGDSILTTSMRTWLVQILQFINLNAMGFKWLQSTFAYDIIFTRHLNFSTWFTKNSIIPGAKKDLIMD